MSSRPAGNGRRFTDPAGGRVRERLAASSILLTGASGFLGQAVLSTLLGPRADFQRLVVVLRAPDDAAARSRLENEVLTGDAFGALPPARVRESLAGGRLSAVAADLGADELADRPEWGQIDTVIHCAASVSFEEPLDDALTLNALGPSRLLEALRAAGSEPHFIHVSTAYVADPRSRFVTEDGSPHPAVGMLDPAALLGMAREWRLAAELEAGGASVVEELSIRARREASHRPDIDIEGRTEELQRRRLQRRLADEGRRHAIAAGWPDTYALSKALGERLVLERSSRTTLIRPSIIESALGDPYAGWLEGIKVADPLILAYAAGGLTHLPGRATNTIDIVPVDHVANACVVAAADPPGTRLRTIALVSGARNALTLGALAAHTKAYFRQEPLRRPDGSAIRIGELAFVDRDLALRRARRREWLARTTSRAATSLPCPEGMRAALGKNSAMAARIVRMLGIYAPYTELDCVFDDRNALALASSLGPADRADFPFDTAAIPWERYLEGTHLPRVHALAERRS